MRLLMRLFATLTFIAIPCSAFAAGGFTVTSPDFVDGGTIPMAQVLNSFGCKGRNISPALHWSGAPAGTHSFAVTVYDPDARGGWWHWLVFNIPAAATGLPAGAGAKGSRMLPHGAIQGRTSFGFSHYGGPCPPAGDAPHHYHVTVYALKLTKLPLDARATGVRVTHYLHLNALAEAQLTGLYGRDQ